MNIYRISQIERTGYDTYDSAIVIAGSIEEAKKVHPSGNNKEWASKWGEWCDSPHQVTVELIGVALKKYKKPRVILASYNAG